MLRIKKAQMRQEVPKEIITQSTYIKQSLEMFEQFLREMPSSNSWERILQDRENIKKRFQHTGRTDCCKNESKADSSIRGQNLKNNI